MATEPSVFDLVPGGKLTVAGFFIFLLLLVPMASAYHEVPAGHVGVEKSWSAVNGDVHDSGQAWTVPVKESVKVVEVRPRTYTMSDSQGEGQKAGKRDAIEAPTLNGTSVRVDVTVRYRVNPDEANKFVKQWNDLPQAEKRLIRPAVRSALRDEAAGIPTSEIYTSEGRRALEEAAREVLKKEFGDEALVLEAVQVRNVNLPDAYQEQLNQKEIAKQKVQKQKYLLQKAKKKKKRQKVQAEAEAAQIRIKGKALRNNPEVLKLRYIEALKQGDTIYVPSDSSSMTLTKEVNSTAEGR